MMEDNGTREQTGALPLEGSFPEAVPGTVGESHIRKGNAVFSVPSGTEKFPERESEREEYWNSVLTGDVMTIPREVRLKAEAMYPEGTADRERIAACVMQSWVADSGAIPRERIRRDWKSIREQVARQYGASGKSDDELFVAVSMHNQVRLSRRDALFELYQEEYERALSGGGTVPDERGREAISAWPEDLQAVARQLKGRAVSDALDDRNRQADAAGIIRKGLEGLVASEGRFSRHTAEPESRCRSSGRHTRRGLPGFPGGWRPSEGVPHDGSLFAFPSRLSGCPGGGA